MFAVLLVEAYLDGIIGDHADATIGPIPLAMG